MKNPFIPIIKGNAIKIPKNAFLEKVKNKEIEISIKKIANNHLFLEFVFAIKKNVKQKGHIIENQVPA